MPPPGISRAEFLAGYTSRKGPELTDFWADELHSKSSQQHYADFVKSRHYRNDRRMVTCSSCHDSHGQGAHDGELRGDPADGALCAQCHIVDVTQHVLEETGSTKLGSLTSCTQCHYYKTAQSGAGREGLLLSTPTGNPSDVDIVFWENDTSSHLTTVPTKTNAGVAGIAPGLSMPVPYTNQCGVCHDASDL
jgi:predicted CXXCH cytochrome family protein